jgi:hypothetical protein
MKQPPVYGLTATLTSSGVRLLWKWSSDAPITDFFVEKKALLTDEFSTVSTIPFDINGINTVPSTSGPRMFFYDDASGEPGSIYRVSVLGDSGASPSCFAIAPSEDIPVCYIHGYITSAEGEKGAGTEIHVSVLAQKKANWIQSPGGTVAQNADAILVIPGARVLTSEADGQWGISLPQGAVAQVSVPSVGFSVAFNVPMEEGPVNIRDVQPLRQGTREGFWDQSDQTKAELLRA